MVKIKITVFFEQPFWVGICERQYKEKYEVCKIVFGAEPKDNEVYEFLLRNFNRLKFSPSIKVEKTTEKAVNPKRMLRNIKKQLKKQKPDMGTKAQQALKLQHEQGKLQKKTQNHEKNEEEKQRQFILRQEKRKEKHRGH